MCPLAFGVAFIVTVLHAVEASPEIPGVAMTFEEPEPLAVDGCQEQSNLRQAGSAGSISVNEIYRVLPEIAYIIAGIAAGHDNLLQQNLIYLDIYEEHVRAYRCRFVDGDFEVNQTSETLQLHFHRELQELAMQNIPVVQAEYHHRWAMLELRRSYCDAFRRGSTDLSFDYHVNVGSKKFVWVTFDKQVLNQKVNELEHNLTQFTKTIIGSLAVKPQDVTLIIDGGSSFCLPDRRLFRDFFPQQVVELHRPSGLSGGLAAFDTQRAQWFLGEEQVQVESYDSPELGLVICKVREEVALREEVEALRREKMEEVDRKLGKIPELDGDEKMEREVQTVKTSLLQVLKDDFALAHPRYNSCWSLEKPTTEDCRHDANQSGGQPRSVLKFQRIYKEILWHSRRSSQGSQVLPRPLQCQGLSHSMVLLEADNLVKPQGKTLVETLLEFIRTSQSECGVHMEQPASTEPRFYAQVWVRAEDENLLRDCIKKLASQKMKKSNVKKLKLKHRTEVNNDYGDSPRTFDSDVI